MKKLVLLTALFGMSMACAPKKHGPVDKVPDDKAMAKVAAKANPYGHKPTKENAELQAAIKDIKFERKVDKNTDTIDVTLTITFDKEKNVLPEGHEGVIVVAANSKSQKATAGVQAKTSNDSNGNIQSYMVCDNHCKTVIVWLKVTAKKGGQVVDRVTGFGYDGLAKKKKWTSDKVEEEKKK